MGEPAGMRSRATAESLKEEDSGPGLLERFKTTPVYDRVKTRLETLAMRFSMKCRKRKDGSAACVDQVAQGLHWRYLPASDKAPSMSTRNEPNRTSSRSDSSYQPALERQRT